MYNKEEFTEENVENKIEEITSDFKKVLEREKLDEYDIKIIICYCLWKVKNDTSIRTVDDLDEKGCLREGMNFYDSIYGDVSSLFREYPEEWNKLFLVASRYSESELAECVLKSKYYNDNTYEIMPQGIAGIVDKLLEIEDGDRVIQFNCEIGELINEELLCIHPRTYFTGYSEIAVSGLIFASIKADIMRHKLLVLTDSILDDNNFGHYDKALVSTFINTNREKNGYSELNYLLKEVWGDFPDDTSEAWKMIGCAVKSVKNNGKVIAIVNGGEITVKQTESARKIMVDNGYIDTVIALPDKLYSDTWVNSYIIVFGSNCEKIKFYDARKKFATGRVKGKRINIIDSDAIEKIISGIDNLKLSKFVTRKEVQENNYNLNPALYTVDDFAENVQKIELGKLINGVKRGMSLSAIEMDEVITEVISDTKCIIPSSISEGVVLSDLYYDGKKIKNGKNTALSGNILISKSGKPFKVAVTDDSYLVIGNIYILEVDNSIVSSEYIKCFLSSKMGQLEIERLSVGPKTKVINIDDVRRIRIPVFTGDRQKKLNEKSKKIIEIIESSHKKINDAINELNMMFLGE